VTAEKPTPVVPKLRFPEFRSQSGWFQKSLGEILMPIVREREKPTVPYTGLGIRSHGKGTFRKEREQPDKISMERLYEVDCNDLIINITFAWEGAVAIVRPEDSGALVSHRFPTYQFKQNAALPAFVRYPVLDEEFIHKLGVISPGGAGRNRVLNKRDFLKIELALPKVAEQQKIAACLGSLDDLIAAESRKLKALLHHKEGLMQQLFPQLGEVVPRLRFPEFHDAREWQTRKLGNLVLIQSGGTPSKANPAFWDGSIPWVSAKDMKRLLLEDTEDHISIAAVDNGARVVPAGTLLMLTRGMTLLKDVPICLLGREMSFNQDVKGLRPKMGANGVFLAFALLANKQRLLKMVDIAGHGTGKLNTDELEAFELVVPRPAEQQRIAECLLLMDEMLTGQSQKVEVLKAHKKGLLQQLFPSMERNE
jgi:type I restriction enzyme S subunit